MLIAFAGTAFVPYLLNAQLATIPLTLGVVAAAISDIDDRFSVRILNLIYTYIGFFITAASVQLLFPYPIVFAIGAFKGPQFTPYAFIYKTLVKPRLKGEVPTEDVRPPQFAQSVGLLFALVAIAGALFGIDALVVAAVSMALGAAFLNAAFNFCLGCEIYLLLLRARSK